MQEVRYNEALAAEALAEYERQGRLAKIHQDHHAHLVGGKVHGRQYYTGTEADVTAQMEAEARLIEAAGGEVVRRSKIGRNQPCPCGSGRKFKKCCISGAKAI